MMQCALRIWPGVAPRRSPPWLKIPPMSGCHIARLPGGLALEQEALLSTTSMSTLWPNDWTGQRSSRQITVNSREMEFLCSPSASLQLARSGRPGHCLCGASERRQDGLAARTCRRCGCRHPFPGRGDRTRWRRAAQPRRRRGHCCVGHGIVRDPGVVPMTVGSQRDTCGTWSALRAFINTQEGDVT